MEPLALALRRELQRSTMREIRAFLGGPPEAWEPLDWRLRDEHLRLKEYRLTGALADYPGDLVASTRLAITTSQLQRNDTQESRWLYHDWRDATDRRQVFEKVFDSLGQFTFLRAEEHGGEAVERDALGAIDHLGREIVIAQTHDPLRELPAERCHHGLLLGLHCVYRVALDQGQQLQYQPDHPEKGLDLAKAEYKGFNHINRFPSPRLSDKREPSGS